MIKDDRSGFKRVNLHAQGAAVGGQDVDTTLRHQHIILNTNPTSPGI